MCTKWFSDGDVHKYFNPYGTPYEAFINYMNVLSDFIIRIENCSKTSSKSKKKAIEDKPKEIAEEVKAKVNIAYNKFSDLAVIPKQKLKAVLSSFDAETILFALQNANNTLKDRVLSNVTNKVLAEFETLDEKVKGFEENKVRNAKRKILNKIKKITD